VAEGVRGVTGAGAQLDPRFAQIRDIVRGLLNDRLEGVPASGDEAEEAVAVVRMLAHDFTAKSSALDSVSRRLDEFLQIIFALVSLDYSQRAQVTENDDIFDGMATGLNLLAEQLASSTVSKTYVHNVLESLSDALIVVEPDATIKTVNHAACDLSGYPIEELIGHPITMIAADISVNELISSGGVSYQEKVYKTKDGRGVPVAFSASVLQDKHGDPAGLVCVARDLTESKRLEEERWRLREAVQRQAVILEELSTPLIPISDDVLVMPLIGTIDDQRAAQITESLLQGIVSRQAKVAIIDVTGVRTMNQSAVQGIIGAAQGARLLGAQVALTGIRPDVAMALVALDAELSGIVTFGSLQNGIVYAMSRTRGG
jgi:rsbT co-antagonist protein RsbR